MLVDFNQTTGKAMEVVLQLHQNGMRLKPHFHRL